MDLKLSNGLVDDGKKTAIARLGYNTPCTVVTFGRTLEVFRALG
jgi:hypothetical protein